MLTYREWVKDYERSQLRLRRAAFLLWFFTGLEDG